LAHAVADDFPAAKFHLIAVAARLGDQIALDLDEELGIGEAHPIPHGGPEHVGILAAAEVERHRIYD
jgi:hypothetical protein